MNDLTIQIPLLLFCIVAIAVTVMKVEAERKKRYQIEKMRESWEMQLSRDMVAYTASHPQSVQPQPAPQSAIWKCSYCNQTNDTSHLECRSCGGPK